MKDAGTDVVVEVVAKTLQESTVESAKAASQYLLELNLAGQEELFEQVELVHTRLLQIAATSSCLGVSTLPLHPLKLLTKSTSSPLVGFRRQISSATRLPINDWRT